METKNVHLHPWPTRVLPHARTRLHSRANQPRRCLLSQLPHLIFYGPPGTGKTSTILACARELFGDQVRVRARVRANSALVSARARTLTLTTDPDPDPNPNPNPDPNQV